MCSLHGVLSAVGAVSALHGAERVRKGCAVPKGCDTRQMQPEQPAKCKKLLDAGAVRLKWPADLEREEQESFTWCILTKDNWNEETVLGWRLSAAELGKRAEAAKTAPKRRRVREE